MAAVDAYFDLGVERVVLGTAAIRDPDLVRAAAEHYPQRVVVAVDAVNSPREFMASRQMVDKRSKPDPVKLADPKVALKELI